MLWFLPPHYVPVVGFRYTSNFSITYRRILMETIILFS